MPRPNLDRVMVSFYMSRAGKAWIDKLAARRKETKADTMRTMLAYAQQYMPRNYQPEEK